MSDASVGAYAGMFSTMLGGLTSAFGAFMGGQAQKEMYDYQAKVAQLNAQISAQNAVYASNVGEIQALNAGLAGAQRMGQIKAAQAASGLDVNTGSAKQVQTSQKEITGLDITQIRSNAAKTAYNYEVQGVQFSAQAGLDTLAGQNAAASGMINAASSLVGAASSVSSEWMRGSQLGLWGGAPSPATPASDSQPLGGSY